MASRSVWLNLVLGSLLLKVVAAGTYPAFVWGSGAYGSTNAPASRVSYEVFSSEALLDVLLAPVRGIPAKGTLLPGGANDTLLQEAKPDLIVVITSQQLTSSALADPAIAQQLKPLHKAVAAAGTSLSLPFVQHKGPGSLAAQAVSSAKSLSTHKVQIHNLCGEGVASPESAEGLRATVLKQQAGVPDVVVFCPPAGSTLSEEVAAVANLDAVATQSGRNFLMLYASEPTPQQVKLDRQSRGLLQLSPEPPAPPEPPLYRACDGTCQTQVKELEAFILAIVIIVALVSGCMLMNMLGTPTRFEAPKEAIRHE